MEFIGTDGNDVLRGTAGNDTLDGGAGDDQLTGSTGDDLIIGGEGNDSLAGGGDLGAAFFASGGRDTLSGGAGDDSYLISQSAPGGTIIEDVQGASNGILIVAENSDLQTLLASSTLPEAEIIEAFANPAIWGDAFIELSAPQPGIVGIVRSDSALVVDINRDGIAEIENDLTVLNFFDEAGNLGAGAPFVLNNITDPQAVADFVSGNIAPNVEEGPDDGSDVVYRFFNNDAGVHFYTANEGERDAVLELDNFSFEGASYNGADPLTGGAIPVYRFLNEGTRVHLYTVSEAEREAVLELDNFSFEGEAFFAYATEVEGSIPIYRFFNPITGAHFYTPSAAERDTVVSDLPDFQSEGVAYYALPSEVPPGAPL